MDYKASGVDIDAGNETVRRIRSLARAHVHAGRALGHRIVRRPVSVSTATAISEPVLVSSADGVGTKLKVAFMTGRHDTIGADLVNHCVNDILVQGAEPLFFLDYLATGRLSTRTWPSRSSAVSPAACRENGCALLGGETAEMPGFYADGEYDIAGFIVGIVERSPADRRAVDRARRRADRTAVRRAAHQRLFAGSTGVVRDDAAGRPTRSCRSSARRSATRCWRRTARICRWCGRCSTRDCVKGHGAHHRRRHHREPSARAARRVPRRDRSARVERAGAVSAAAGARRRFRETRCFARSTWASV